MVALPFKYAWIQPCFGENYNIWADLSQQEPKQKPDGIVSAAKAEGLSGFPVWSVKWEQQEKTIDISFDYASHPTRQSGTECRFNTALPRTYKMASTHPEVSMMVREAQATAIIEERPVVQKQAPSSTPELPTKGGNKRKPLFPRRFRLD